MGAWRRAARRKRTERRWAWLPSIIVAAVICLAWYAGDGLTSLPASTSSGMTMTMVTVDAVNLRSGPATTHGVVAVVEAGRDVTVTGPPQNGFVPVAIGVETGWLAREYLVEKTSTSTSSSGSQVALAAEGPVATEVDEASQTQAATTGASGSTSSPAEQSEAVAGDAERWIRIDRSEATVSLMAGDAVLYVFSGRIGRDPSSDGFYSTAVGTYRVYSMNKGLAPTPFAEDTWLTDWVGFDPVRKNGIHSPVRESDGTIREWQNATTLGCVRLGEDDAVTVFEFANLGMRVEVVE